MVVITLPPPTCGAGLSFSTLLTEPMSLVVVCWQWDLSGAVEGIATIHVFIWWNLTTASPVPTSLQAGCVSNELVNRLITFV